MSAQETDLVIRLLKQSILTVCREAVSYDSKLEVDGIICLSLENNSHQIVVKVHELFQKQSSSRVSNNNFYKMRPKEQEVFSQNIVEQNYWNSCDFPDSDLDLENPENSDCSIEIIATTASLKRKHNVEKPESTYSKRFAYQGKNECRFKPQNTIYAVKAPTQVTIVTQCGSGQQEKFHGNDEDIVLSDKDVTSSISKKQLPCRIEKIAPSSLNIDVTTELETSNATLTFYCKCCDEVFPTFSAFEKHNLQLHTTLTCESTSPNLKSSHNPVCQQKALCSPSQGKREQKSEPRHEQIDLVMCNGGKSTFKVHKDSYATKSSAIMLPNCSNSAVLSLCEKFNSEIRNFQCGICSFNDTSSLKLRKHFLIHEEPPKVFACKNCESQFTDPFVFVAHLHDHSEESGLIFCCCFCNKRFDSFEKMKDHEAIHAENNFHVCSKCSKCFLYKSHLDHHLAAHGDCENDDLLKNKTICQMANQFLCTVCQQGFSSESLLHEHIYYAPHEKNISMKETEVVSVAEAFNKQKSMESDTVRKEIQSGCHVEKGCLAAQKDGDDKNSSLDDDQSSSESKFFTDDERMSNHVSPASRNSQSDKPIQSEDTEITDFPPKLVQSRSNGPNAATEINIDSTFIKLESIADNERTGQPEQPPQIRLKNLHGYAASKSVNNTKNVRTNDFSKQIDQMTFCSNENLGLVALKKYLNHSLDVPQSQEFLQDTKSPMPDKFAQIKVKSGAFERVITPDAAYRTKESFSCSECDTVVQDFSAFDSHSIALHRKFICEYCGKMFTAKPNRERHVRYHTGEKPYKCELCMQSFYRGDDLKYHRTTKHSHIKPFTCNICKLKFSWPKELQHHYRTHSMQPKSILD